MDADLHFMGGPIEDPPDYLLTVGERWECPCGCGFWHRIDTMNHRGLSYWVWCPSCGASAAWMVAPASGS